MSRSWQLQEAKSKFSEVIDEALSEGPQVITRRGIETVPNLASVFGYTNASWTLKADLIAGYVCRVLNYMDKHGYNVSIPQRPTEPGALIKEPILNLTSGYIRRAISMLPQQGSKAPWKLYQNYLRDLVLLRFERVKDSAMEFRKVQVGRDLAHKEIKHHSH